MMDEYKSLERIKQILGQGPVRCLRCQGCGLPIIDEASVGGMHRSCAEQTQSRDMFDLGATGDCVVCGREQPEPNQNHVCVRFAENFAD